MDTVLTLKNNKFMISINGTKVSSSHDKQHLVKTWFRYFLTSKANTKFGFFTLPELKDNTNGGVIISADEFLPRSSNSLTDEQMNIVPEQSEFNINDRFTFVTSLGTMVMNGVVNSMIVSGEGGLGKTYTVMNMVRRAGLIEDVDYIRVAGFTTPKALYRTLYNYNGKTLIFDDCDSAFKDPTSANILKSALDSNKRRRISWYSERAEKGEDALPEYFDFEGKVIFITNIPLNRFSDALRSRSYCIDLTMSYVDKIERMEHIIEDICPEYDMDIKMDALTFLKEQGKAVRSLNFRTLEKVVKIRYGAGSNWQALAKYSTMLG